MLRKMHVDPGSSSTLKIASKWLARCIENHTNCPQSVPTSQTSPRRVISVGDEVTNPFLAEYFANDSPGGWAALSYCWGGEPSMKLTKENMNELKRGISLDKFDTTVRDAILITRSLGLAYLWVDALCISQDEDAQDWKEQSAKMDVIYGQSTVTIVAVSSSSVTQGLLKERQLEYVPIDSCLSGQKSDGPADNSTKQLTCVAPTWNPKDDHIAGPWTTRGWTMQEGLLPNRLIYYTSAQLIWTCCTTIEYERGISKEPQKAILDDEFDYLDLFSKFKNLPLYLQVTPEVSPFKKYQLWYELVEEYSPRHFTHVEDRLVALSGLAKKFGNIIQDEQYVAGLWKQDLLRGLLWYVRGAKLTPNTTTQGSSIDLDNIPSWTWASVAYKRVVNDYSNQEEFRTFAVIEDVQVDLIDESNPFGAVKSGRITITSPTLRFSKLYHKEWRCHNASMSTFERCISEAIEDECVEGTEERSSSSNGRFAALQMLQPFPWSGTRRDLLILESTGKTMQGNSVYRRLGVLTLEHTDPRHLARPRLIERLRTSDRSITSQLNPRSKTRPMKIRQCKRVLEELVADPWPMQTIIIA